MELRSLTLCWTDQLKRHGTDARARRCREQLPLFEQGGSRVGCRSWHNPIGSKRQPQVRQLAVPSALPGLGHLAVNRLALQRGASCLRSVGYHC